MGKGKEYNSNCEDGAKITSEVALGEKAVKRICNAEAKMAPFLKGNVPRIKVVENDGSELTRDRQTVRLNRDDIETRRGTTATTHELAHEVWYRLPAQERATITTAYNAIRGVGDRKMLRPPENTPWSALAESSYVGGSFGHPQDEVDETFASGTANLLNNSSALAEGIAALPLTEQGQAEEAVEAVYCGLAAIDSSAPALKPATRAFGFSPSQC